VYISKISAGVVYVTPGFIVLCNICF